MGWREPASPCSQHDLNDPSKLGQCLQYASTLVYKTVSCGPTCRDFPVYWAVQGSGRRERRQTDQGSKEESRPKKGHLVKDPRQRRPPELTLDVVPGMGPTQGQEK